jgi:hypothetical protein
MPVVPITVAPLESGTLAAVFRTIRQGSPSKPPINAPSVSIRRTFAA